MKGKFFAAVLIFAIIVALFLSPTKAVAQDLNITVTEKDAAIHLKPDAGSRVIQISPVGTVLEAEKKEGEWYQVKIQSRLGVIITGYIHQKFVKSEAGVEEEDLPGTEEKTEGKRALSKGDIGIGIGYVSGSFISDQSSYSFNWSENLLSKVNENGTTMTKIKNPRGVGFSFSYLLFGGIGIQLKLDYNFTEKINEAESLSDYAITWTWTDNRGPFDRSEEWGVSGEFSVIPISLNFLYKFQGEGMIIPYFSAGASYFTGKVKANSTRGLGISWEASGSQFIDYVDVPIKVDESISHFGFNVGGGLDFMFTSSIGLNLEAAYFIGKKSEYVWEHTTGSYKGNIFPDISWSIDTSMVELIKEQVSPFEVNTSFFKVQAGVKIFF